MIEEKRKAYVAPQSEPIVTDEPELLAASAFSEGGLGLIGTGDGTADPWSAL